MIPSALKNMLEYKKDISKYSSFQTQAVSLYFACIQTDEDEQKLPEIFNFARKNNLPIKIIGGGSNILFAFNVFSGIILQMKQRKWKVQTDTNRLYVQAGAGEILTKRAMELLREYACIDWKSAIGLPGFIGGAVVGNAGCYGWEIRHNFKKARCFYIPNQTFHTLSYEDMQFTYRSSFIKKMREYLVLDVLFEFIVPLSSPLHLQEIQSLKNRGDTQPTGKTCGSFFKNPPKNSAGRLIDLCGGKGLKKGGAQISAKHANFFLNIENAHYTDILSLRDIVKTRVFERFGILLEEEVYIIF